ncbi:MAG: carboxypeptidase-like regulatory domain-containing protein, partial [Acidobacteria bacterium]|nr:carboxypeptidase-like regulatory domain-containing protein [Acidobacteriota bacterium]
MKDATGAVIPDAKIAAVQVETGNRFETVSNPTGFFIFPSVQPGRYRLAAESAGLENWEGELLLESGQEAAIDPVLKVGGTTTQITVAGDVTPLVTTTSATISNVVERARIEELPLNGRFFQGLLALTTPGLEGSAGTPQPYGLREQVVQFVQDGASMTNANIGQITLRPPGLDTIQEYRVDMSVPSAR